jgi:hypothetical protein
MTNKIFPELAGINKLNYLVAEPGPGMGGPSGAEIQAGAAKDSNAAKPTTPSLVEKATTTDEITLAAGFLKARGPVSNALHQEIAVSADLEHAQGAIQILRGMDDVSNKHGHLLGLELNAVGDRLRQVDLSSKRGNFIKVAVGAGIAFLAFHTATEGLSTIDAAQKLAAGAQELTKGLQNSTSVLNIDFSNINKGSQEMNQVISQLTQHGIDTVVSGAATAGALLARPFEVVRKASHGLGKAFNVAGGAVGKALGTERVINPPAPKANLQVIGGSK